MGKSYWCFKSALVNLGADIVGLNCHLGPLSYDKSLKQVPLFAQSYLSAYQMPACYS